MARPQVTVYWSSTWQSCQAAKEFLSSHGVPFTAMNIAEDAVAREELIARTDRMAVPVIVVGDDVIVGFDRGRLKRLLGIWAEVAGVACPDCGTVVAVPFERRTGDLLECPNCAGHALRLRCQDGRWAATLAHQVSCPLCDEVLTLPEGAIAGDVVTCCGRRFRLSLEYGAFAADEMEEA